MLVSLKMWWHLKWCTHSQHAPTGFRGDWQCWDIDQHEDWVEKSKKWEVEDAN